MGEFPPCPQRHKLTKVGKDGVRIGVQQCAESSCSDFGKVVTPDVCGACLVRKVVLSNAKRVAAKKPDIATLSLVAKAVPDTKPKRPGWVDCKDRQLITIVKCCGKTEETTRCDSKQCDHYGQSVTAEICKSCPFRRA
jgi:hypothetical protein